MSNQSFSTGFRNALINAGILTAFDNGFLDIYSGTIPADADATEGAGTLLASIILPATDAFVNAAVAGSLSKDTGAWQDTSANAGGTAAWCRLYANAHTLGASTTAVRVDGDVTITGGAGDVTLSSLTVVLADSIVVDTFTIALPLSAA